MMNTIPEPRAEKEFLTRVVEAAIRIGLLAGLAAWCFLIVSPFLVPIVWGVIIAVATYHGYARLEAAAGNRRGVAATIYVLLGLVLLIVPAAMLGSTLVDGAQALADGMQGGHIQIPPPPESVASWPFIGKPLAAFWDGASSNLEATLEKIGPQLKAFGGWLLSTAAGAGLGILQFIIAIIIAGVLLAHAEAGGRSTRAIAMRLAGDQGAEFAQVAEATVRSVARGILGVALIQSVLAGIGFLVMGIPGAGLWALVALLLSVVQIGIFPVVLPILIYAFYTADTLPFVLFLIWSVFVGALDNILKPILLGRGVKVPMVIIFIGAIGGFITSGIIGLFIGAVILALGYKLFLAWLYGEPRAALQSGEAETQVVVEPATDRNKP
jgi:predicted PurR-regulated permease PerM